MEIAGLALGALVIWALRIIARSWGPWLVLFACFVLTLLHPLLGIVVWVFVSVALPAPPFHEDACPNCGANPPGKCKVGPGDFSNCKAPRPGLF